MRKIIFSILKKFLKVTAILVLSIFSLILACFLIMALQPDEKPFDDSAFLGHSKDIPRNENGMIQLLKAFDELKEDHIVDEWERDVNNFHLASNPTDSDDELRNGPTDDQLSQLKKVYDLKFGKIESIIWSYKIFIWPEECGQTKSTIPKYCHGKNVLRLSNISRYMIIQAQYDLGDNREDAALRKLQFVFKISGFLQSAGNLISYHIGIAIHTMCLSNINSMIDNNEIPPDALQTVFKLIEINRVSVQSLKDSFSGEYYYQKNMLENEKHARDLVCNDSMEGDRFGVLIWPTCRIAPSKLFIKRNTTERKLYLLYSFFIHEAELSTSDFKTNLNTTPGMVYNYNPKIIICHSFLLNELPLLKSMRLFIKGNAVGEDLVWHIWRDFRIIKWTYLAVEAKNNALLFKTAIKIYENDNGKLPEKGSVLIPKYLDRIPEDPFSRKPLKYSAKRKMIYSIGFDLKDNGGLSKKEFIDFERKDLVKEKDLVLHLE